jgi:isopenicillin-N epimerase
VQPVERIVALAAARGVETLVDGAHAPGMLPLALERLGAAYYTGNCHKWLCTPKGSAFLYVRRDLQNATPPLVVSHGRNSNRRDRSRFRLEADFTGTCDPSAWLAIPDAIAFLEGLFPDGFDGLRDHNRRLVLDARARFESLLGLPPSAPESMIGSLASVPLPRRAPDEPPPSLPGVDPLWDWFGERRIEIVVTPFGRPGERLLRVSGQAYNAADEYEAAAQALAEWLDERRRTPG